MRTPELLKRAAYIVGVAEAPLGKVSNHSELSMVALAAREALAEAGMTLADVDGVFVNYMGEEGSIQVGEYLGIQPRYADSSDLGGGAFEAFVHHALLAVACGRCEVALIAYASRQRSKRNRRRVHLAEHDSLTAQFDIPHGLPTPIGHYALIAARHMHVYGTTPEQLASVAVTARQWAQRNPKAWVQEPLNVEDVLNSPRICDPFHKLDCCLVTDGGGAVIVAGPARARDAAKRPIKIIGAGESHTHWHPSQMADMTTSAAVVSGQEAFSMAGVTPDDVDFIEPYDAFTITPILQVEDLGFCMKGEGGAFIESGTLAPHGALPGLTSGGGLSYNHPGALGVLLLVEAVRQLRGEAEDRQVPGPPSIGLVNGLGGMFSFSSTVILARD